ncbi:transcription factor NIGTH1-like [Phragmites australis]|uniref:transcription factor NIGTH1-like n=1 Tax=Phragmites australis TaxID=29695 RepID=UPI002D783AA6|nr:transcription factor NIGTH1-like [Phragmites australis]
MASSPPDLTLDYQPNGGSGTAGGMYAVIGKPQEPLVDGHHRLTTEQATHRFREFLSRLEEERLKIDAFKRELPLCMQLLNQAMEAYRQQLEAYQMGSQQGAARALVLEEFMPLKNIGIDTADKPGNPPSEKASWMESAQLWNGQASAADTAAKGPQTAKECSEHPLPIDSLGAAGQHNGSAFLPFAKDKAVAEGAVAKALPELALAPAEKDAVASAAEVGRKPYLDAGSNNDVLGSRRDIQNGVKPASTAPEGHVATAPPQTHRKARRCWSPELHRRFVNALQILGGAQVATPKQIRELMKVDGLTNDEVKSHLQKYRLHTRRPMQAPPTPVTAAPQLVVLGGIWVPPEYTTQYGAHPATQPHYTAAVAAQEYYPSPAAVHHLQHHPAAAMMHRAAPAPLPPGYKAAMAVSPPGSEGRGSAGGGSVGGGGGGGGRERSESIEEEGEGEERDEEEEDDDDDEMAAAKANGEEAASAGVIKY